VGRRTEGEVLEQHQKRGRTYALRFLAYGERQYVTLGCETDGWDRDRAGEELQNILADVRRGIWVPPPRRRRVRNDDAAAEAPREVPLFGPFARGIVMGRRGQVAANTSAKEEWALAHLNPYFSEWRLDEIDAQGVDDYRLQKVRESEERARAIERGTSRRNDHGQSLRPLSPRSINDTIDALRWLLGIAHDYGHVGENAAAGRRRRLAEPPVRPVHLDAPAQIEALLEAGAELDHSPRCHCSEREAILATLVLAGPRADELCHLLWRDIDLANSRIYVGRSKTQAGLREVPMLPLLRDILAAYKARAYRGGPDGLVFPNTKGGRRDKDTLRSGVLLLAFERADRILDRRGQVPLPKGITAHKLRHTFTSILVACGTDPNSVMRQLGHTDPGFTLRVYTHMMARSEEERTRLKALVRGERVAAAAAPRSTPLGLEAYERPILRALAERGGRAPRAEILAAVGEALAPRLGAADRERLPSGEERWRPRIGKARSRLVRRGWLVPNARCADWELTATGTAKARREGLAGGGGSSTARREGAVRDGVAATDGAAR
jgi:integrase